MAKYTKSELSKKLLQVETVINSLRKTQYSKSEQGVIQEQIKRLKGAKEKLTGLLKEEKTVFIRTAKGENKAMDYNNDQDLLPLKNNQDIKSIETGDGKKIKEAAGKKYTAKESEAVGKAVAKSLLKVLRAQGDDVVEPLEPTGEEINKFTIHVKYGNDKGHDNFKFDLNPDTESIIFQSETGPIELVDFVITQGNTVSLPTPELEDKLSDAMKKYTSEPSDEEYDQMAAMEPEQDPSKINKYIPEGVLEERTFNITGLGTFEFTGMRDDLVMGSQNNGPVRTFTKEKVEQDNPGIFDRQPRERKPQGVRPYSQEEYREILQGAIDDAGSTKFAYDLAGSMIYDPQILARLKKDYPGESARELKQQLQYDLEACDSPEEIAEGISNTELYKPYAVKDPSNPNFLKVFIKYPEGVGHLAAYGQTTMSGQEREYGIKKAMDIGQAVAEKLQATYNLEDLDVTDNGDGKVIVFAVSDDFIKMNTPTLQEDDHLQPDDESSMAKAQLRSIQSNASKLMNLLGDNEQLDAWVQSKLTKAEDYLDATAGYLESEEDEQAPITVAVALDEKKATYCGDCGYTHVKGTDCPKPSKNEALDPVGKEDDDPLPHEELHGYTSETTPKGEHEVWAIYFDPKTDTYNKRHRVPAETVFGKNASIRTPMRESISKKELKEIMLEAYVELLREEEAPELKTSTQEILGKFPPAKKVLVRLMTQEFDEFVEDVKWLAPKPTTFQVVLKNGQTFTLKWAGKPQNGKVDVNDPKYYMQFDANIEGKDYYLGTVTTYQQALDALNRVLINGPISQGEEPGGEEFGAPAEPAPAGGGGGDLGGGEAAPDAGPEPETPEAL